MNLNPGFQSSARSSAKSRHSYKLSSFGSDSYTRSPLRCSDFGVKILQIAEMTAKYRLFLGFISPRSQVQILPESCSFQASSVSFNPRCSSAWAHFGHPHGSVAEFQHPGH